MNKAELVEVVANGAGVSKGEAEGVLNTFFETVQTSAKAGDTIGWPGFGKFSTRERAARAGRNPQTGAAVKVKASTAMKFSSSSVLKSFLNTKGRKAATKKAAAPARSTAATRGTTGTSSSATKAAPGRATASKAAPGRATASKASANSSPAKKASANKATASKATASKATASKAAPSKAPASKAAAGKAAPSRAAAKKAPAKRSTAARAR